MPFNSDAAMHTMPKWVPAFWLFTHGFLTCLQVWWGYLILARPSTPWPPGIEEAWKERGERLQAGRGGEKAVADLPGSCAVEMAGVDAGAGAARLHAPLGHLDVLADGLLLEGELRARRRRLEAEHFRLERLRQGGKTSQPPIMPSGRTQPGITARAYEPSSLARSKFTLTSGSPHLVPEAREDGRELRMARESSIALRAATTRCECSF